MALTSVHRSFSPARQLSCACMCSSNQVSKDRMSATTTPKVIRRYNGTYSSAFIKRFRTDDADKRDHKDVDSLTASPLEGPIPPDIQKEVKSKLSIYSLGAAVPLKIAELNKYVANTSKKILSSGYGMSSFNKDNGDKSNNSKASVEDPNAFSLDETVNQMNESIVSFYDTSCATNNNNFGSKQHTNLPQPLPPGKDDEDSHSPDVPQTVGPLFPLKPSSEAKKKRAEKRRADKISRLSLETRTKALVLSLRSAHSLMSKITRLEELCDHLIAHPECVWDAASEKAIPTLLILSRSQDKILKGLANEALSLLGHCGPLKSPGIRVLSIDGGGTRGLVTIEFLKALEKATNKKTHELFDYVCGVSTGALLAVMVCLYKLPLDRCEQLYKDCAVQMFTRNRVIGTTKLVWNYGFYDSQSWETILKKEIGERRLVEFSREEGVPKMSAVSSLISAPRMSNYLFRTYNPPPGATSQYPGNCKHRIWEVIRASSAAPGYFEPFTLGDEVHEDGGILTNNPTALAIHESRLLWPNENFHCVVSLGTGRFESFKEEAPAKVSLKRRISTIVDSATDTEAVHHTLQDLLPARSYFRFNPYLSEEFFLDEIRPDKMSQMQLDAQMYSRRNNYKLTAAAERLTQKRTLQQHVGDALRRVVNV